jgi:hypothetical protein
LTGTPLAPTAAVGTNTTQIATTAFVTTAAANVTSGFRNIVVNGGMDIWQRGTSFSNPASGSFLADRWSIQYNGSGATRTISQVIFNPTATGGTTAPTGTTPNYFLRYNTSVAGTGASSNYLRQRIENVRLITDKSYTLSFYAKASASITLPSVFINQVFSGSFSFGLSVASSVAVTTSWQRFSYTFTGGSTNRTTTYGVNETYNELQFSVPLNSTFTLDLWGVQIEAGSTATPFEQRPETVELSLCQRYYYRINSENTGFRNIINGVGRLSSATQFYGQLFTPVPMRVRPQSLEYAGLTCTDFVTFETIGGTWALNSALSSKNCAAIDGSGFTFGATTDYVGMSLQSTSTNYVAVYAEL